MTGDSVYQTRGDLIFEGGVGGAWIDQDKQFSQNYRWSFDFVTWRQNPNPDSLAGDVNRDGVGNILDQQLCANTVLGVTNDNSIRQRTDVNMDGFVNNDDCRIWSICFWEHNLNHHFYQFETCFIYPDARR